MDHIPAHRGGACGTTTPAGSKALIKFTQPCTLPNLFSCQTSSSTGLRRRSPPERLMSIAAQCSAPTKLTSNVEQEFGGADRDRTGDPLVANQVLSQLSYSPVEVVGLGRVELPTSPLSGVRSSHLSYRPGLLRGPGAQNSR